MVMDVRTTLFTSCNYILLGLTSPKVYYPIVGSQKEKTGNQMSQSAIIPLIGHINITDKAYFFLM